MICSASRVFWILLLFPTISYAGFTCVSLQGQGQIERCGDSEACFYDTHGTNSPGNHGFGYGCRESQECLRVNRTSTKLLISTCCLGNFCNAEYFPNLQNACTNNPCVSGTCHNYGSSYICTCYGGYTGVNCDILHHDACNNTCVHGTCSLQGLTYSCKCNNGYIGAYCDQDVAISHCLTGACDHVTCDYNPGGYVCRCYEGNSGKTCGQPSDVCRNSPCVHGTCTTHGWMYSCKCDNGYMGTNCDQAVAVDHCSSSPCRHGTCTNSANGFSCTCFTGYSGNTCDLLAIQGPCVPNPCVHGTCARDVTSTTDFHCLCSGEYSGKVCDQGCPGVDSNCRGGAECVVLDYKNCHVCRSECIIG